MFFFPTLASNHLPKWRNLAPGSLKSVLSEYFAIAQLFRSWLMFKIRQKYEFFRLLAVLVFFELVPKAAFLDRPPSKKKNSRFRKFNPAKKNPPMASSFFDDFLTSPPGS